MIIQMRVALLAAGLSALAPIVAVSQIERDGTIGPSATVQPLGPNFVIPETMGEFSGSNLFHSFSQFNIQFGESATFINGSASSVSNVISRVTGDGNSFLNGYLSSAIPNANLILINPNGVVFGANASVNVDGMFKASTASALTLSNGDTFDVNAAAPVLSVAEPASFGFLSGIAGDITFSGGAISNTKGLEFSAENISVSGTQMSSFTNATRAGDVSLTANRTIELRNEAAVSSIAIDAGGSGNVSVTAGERITLDSQSTVFNLTARQDAGQITINAPVVDVVGLSAVNALSIGTGSASDITINASERFTLSDSGEVIDADGNPRFQTSYVASNAGAGGDAGGVNVTSGAVLIAKDAHVFTNAWGTSNGGDVTISGGVVSLAEGGRVTTVVDFGSSGSVSIRADNRVTLSGEGGTAFVSTSSAQENHGGNIVFDAPIVEILDGAFVLAVAGGTGDSGDVTIRAPTRFTMSGNPSRAPSGRAFIRTDSGGLGSSGDITIETGVAEVKDGSFISTALLEQNIGAADSTSGAISFSATERITLSGRGFSTSDEDVSAFIVASTENERDGGAITVQAPIVELLDGAFIKSDTSGDGASGDITVRAPVRLTLSDATGSTTTSDGGAFITAGSLSAGNAGSVSIEAGNVELLDDSGIETRSLGQGLAGTIDLHLTGNLTLQSSKISTDAQQSTGGDISIHAPGLINLNNASITTSVKSGTGVGGNIAIGHGALRLRASEITAQAEEGSGGEISISATRIVQSLDSKIDATSSVGIDGDVIVDGTFLDVEQGEAPKVEYLRASQLLAPQCEVRGASAGRFAVSSRPGAPVSPEDLLPSFDDAFARIANEQRLERATAGQYAYLEGATAFRRGNFRGARAKWDEALTLHTARGDAAASAMALLGRAESEQALGAYGDSLDSLRQALAVVQRSGDVVGEARVLNVLGQALLGSGQATAAERLLVRGAERAGSIGERSLQSRIMNNLGNLHAMRGVALKKSETAYETSAALARDAGDNDSEAKALANGIRIALRRQDAQAASKTLTDASRAARGLAATQQKAALLIHLAESYKRLGALSQSSDENALAAQGLLSAAIELSESLNDERTLSYALGDLGELYRSQGRYNEALYLSRKALRAAESVGAPESIYRWHWLEGRVLWSLDERDEAMAAYARAVAVLEETRQDSLLRYADAASYFKRLVAPVYLDLVDALLTRADEVGIARGEYLRRARDTAELLKTAELRNHFQDECLASLEAKEQHLDTVAPDAVVVYPIVFADRLELLVSGAGGLERHRVAVSADELTATARAFRRALQSGAALPEAHALGQRLYKWLVAPYAQGLALGAETLVFVPDGALRTIPMAALHDGQRYLVERYALAVTPSLTLTDPKPLDAAKAKVLLAGVSEAVSKDFEALAGVPGELDSIHALYDGEVLLDGAFTRERFERALKDEAVSIVHIASHGVFTGDARDSFVLAHDGPMSFEQLQDNVGITKFRRKPLELLVLSACETAVGNDGAALGLAGLAVKAGARSALGSLWTIADEGTETLMGSFYAHMQTAGGTKANALRKAQLDLLSDARWSHPSIWSPYLLINNWL